MPSAPINPFSAILTLKNAAVTNMDIAPTAAEAPRRGKTFLRNSGYRQIPLMLVQETSARSVVLQGREAILDYLLERGLILSRLTF